MKKIAEIGTRIKEYREVNNLTLSDLETMTGVPAQTLNRYELGQRSPKSELVAHIAEKMNVNPLWLFGYEESEASEAEAAIWEKIKASPRKMEIVAWMADIDSETFKRFDQILTAAFEQ